MRLVNTEKLFYCLNITLKLRNFPMWSFQVSMDFDCLHQNLRPPGTNLSSGREKDLNPGPPDYKSSAHTTRPRRLHLMVIWVTGSFRLGTFWATYDTISGKTGRKSLFVLSSLDVRSTTCTALSPLLASSLTSSFLELSEFRTEWFNKTVTVARFKH